MSTSFENENTGAYQNKEMSSAMSLSTFVKHLQGNSIIVMVSADNAAGMSSVTEPLLIKVFNEALFTTTPINVMQLDNCSWAVSCGLVGDPYDPEFSLYVHTICRRFETEINQAIREPGVSRCGLKVNPVASMRKTSVVQGNLDEMNSLLDVIVNGRLRTQFQPIVNLNSGRIAGYEALIRGDSDSPIRRPGEMLHIAERSQMISWFDMACLEQCFSKASEQGLRHPLFINIEAEGLEAIHLHSSSLAERALKYGIHPDQVVVEITERQALGDFPRLIEGIKHLKDQGFRFAVDDAGAGYNSLEIIVELKPDYVKVDRRLVAGIDTNGTKRGLIASLVRYSRQIGTSVLGEGIETQAELETMIDLGVNYAQGYLLARPSNTFDGISKDLRKQIVTRSESRNSMQIGRSRTLSSMIHAGTTITISNSVSTARKIFIKDSNLASIVVLRETGMPHGVILREDVDLTKKLENSIQVPLDSLMKTDILCVDESLLVIDLPKIISRRGGISLDRDIVVVNIHGEFTGVIPMRDVLETLSTQQQSAQRYSDSLSGLPNKVVLEQVLRERLSRKDPIGIIRADVMYLDNYNRVFGTAHGDELIKGLVDLLSEMQKSVGTAQDLITHMGGDDFVVLTTPDRVHNYCDALQKGFNSLINNLYSNHTIRNGYMELEEGHGVRKVPLCTLALAGMTGRSVAMINSTQTLDSLHKLLRAVQDRFGGGILIDKMPQTKAA